MKKNIFFLSLFSFIGLFSFAQSITSFTLDPANPTTNDTVKVIANLQFTTSGCALSSKNHTSISSTSFAAFTHHCVGIAQAICNTSDTFNLGMLPADNYSFLLTLTSGSGPVPCTPGIVPNDTDTLFFSVQTVTGIEEVSPVTTNIYPNPAQNFINLENPPSKIQQVKFISLDGSRVYVIEQPNRQIDISSLAKGIYFIQLFHKEGVETKKLVKY